MKLQDPDYTKILIVTMAETTPVQEAKELQNDLARVGIEPYGWVINGSFVATDTTDPLLACRAVNEMKLASYVQTAAAMRIYLVPWNSSRLVDVDH